MRLWFSYIVLLLISVFICGDSYAYQPVFKGGIQIKASGVNIDIGTYSIPNVYDWNNDGRKDLLIGVGVGASPYFDTGRIRLYLNSGTDASPSFTTFSWIQAGGTDIAMPFY